MRVSGTVDRSAIVHNLSVVRQCAPRARVMAVIKSNAYGHGLVPIAKALQASADAFAVATIEEAVALRRAGIDLPICVLSGFYLANQVTDVQQYRLHVVVHCSEQIELLKRADPSRSIYVWMKINTGMNRLGFSIQLAAERLNAINSISHCSVQGVMSHFASADELDSDFTQVQIEVFKTAAERFGLPLSIANSAGILKWPASHFDWVRPGIMLYGASPFAAISAAELGLKPAMTVRAAIIAINDVSPNECVGYGQAWTSSKNTPVGIVACGYGDGFSRSIAAGAEVLVAGQRAKVIGRVSMDTFAVDLSDCPAVRIGAPVTLFGEGMPVERLARAAGTIAYETLNSMHSRQVSMQYR